MDVWPKMVTLHTAEEGGTKVIKKKTSKLGLSFFLTFNYSESTLELNGERESGLDKGQVLFVRYSLSLPVVSLN